MPVYSHVFSRILIRSHFLSPVLAGKADLFGGEFALCGFAASRGAWVHLAPWRLWGLHRRQPERVDFGPLRLKFAMAVRPVWMGAYVAGGLNCN